MHEYECEYFDEEDRVGNLKNNLKIWRFENVKMEMQLVILCRLLLTSNLHNNIKS
jgi:hypothetical protein